jgi:hypothetical protein
VHLVIAKGVQSQALLGIKGMQCFTMMVVLKHPQLSIAIVIVKMIMFVVTQLLVNVFVKQHFSRGVAKKV